MEEGGEGGEVDRRTPDVRARTPEGGQWLSTFGLERPRYTTPGILLRRGGSDSPPSPT